MKVLLITPPLTQLNTPYPATAYMTGFLRKHGHSVSQADLSIGLVLRLLSKTGLGLIFQQLRQLDQAEVPYSESVGFFIRHFDRYSQVIEPTLKFLQGKDPSLALRIVSRAFLP